MVCGVYTVLVSVQLAFQPIEVQYYVSAIFSILLIDCNTCLMINLDRQSVKLTKFTSFIHGPLIEYIQPATASGNIGVNGVNSKCITIISYCM